MARTLSLLLATLLGVVASHPMEGGYGYGYGGGEMAGGLSGGRMEKLGMLLKLEQALRDRTEQRIRSDPDEIEEIHEQFVKYVFARHHYEVAKRMTEAVDGKGDFMKMAFKHFMDKMTEKGQMGQMGQMGGDSMEMMGGDSGEEPMGGGMEGKMKLKLMTLWKLFAEFEMAWMQQNTIVKLGLDTKTTRALFFETFGRFVKNAMMIKEKSMQLAKVHAFVEASQQRAKTQDNQEDIRDMFKQFVQHVMSEQEGM